MTFGERLAVSYANDADKRLIARVIHEWKRGDIPAPIMSASSGPKDYLSNRIFAMFEAVPSIERVLWLIGEFRQSVPFCLYFAAGGWYDCTAKPVTVAEAPA